MGKKPVVSILTSMYKASDFLFPFLLDLKRQSIFHDCELILLDANDEEHNPDKEIVDKFLDLPNIKYHYIGKCSVYEAWNIGIKLSSSPIITNWNVDDRRKFNSLEKQVNYLQENPDVDLCYGQLKVSEVKNENFEDCKSRKIWPILDGTIENQLRHNSPHCLPVWRKNVHDRFGFFDESYFCASDYDMWFRILKGGGKLQKIDEEIGVYYENPESISRNRITYDRAIKEVLKVREIYSI